MANYYRAVTKSLRGTLLYVCSINVKINKKSGSVPPNFLNIQLRLSSALSTEEDSAKESYCSLIKVIIVIVLQTLLIGLHIAELLR